MKTCVRCGAVKQITEFYRHKRSADGRNSYCQECSRSYAREWKKNNPERVNEGRLRWKEANPNKVREVQKKANQNRPQNYARDLFRLKKYGLTPEAFDEMYIRQGGACAVCGSGGRLHVDHCHTTGITRGLLCFRCNAALGLTGESRTILELLAIYLDSA